MLWRHHLACPKLPLMTRSGVSQFDKFDEDYALQDAEWIGK